MSAVAQAYLAACLVELDALKPGNVHRHADGHRMTVADFERSARVSAPEIARAGAPFGARARAAVAATLAAVGQNTHLGIVLLCAPLAAAAERGGDLRSNLAGVLAAADLDDSRAVFAAIAAAQPGGLGRAEAYDVREAPTAALQTAMSAAAERDLVARQYVTGFEDVFGCGTEALLESRRAGATEPQAAESVFLAFLSARPDSHIARKFGVATAEAVRRDAAARGRPDRAGLAAWDAELKARGLNPGTSADLTVATLFADYLATASDERLAPVIHR